VIEFRPNLILNLLRQPLFRLLLINLALGSLAAVLLVGGMLALNSQGLRDLVLSDCSPALAIGLLLSGFIVTFGSVVMGSAIMAIGKGDDEQGG
jgi:hypothetical protein